MADLTEKALEQAIVDMARQARERGQSIALRPKTMRLTLTDPSKHPKTYGAVVRNGRRHYRNYGRVLKSGGLSWPEVLMHRFHDAYRDLPTEFQPLFTAQEPPAAPPAGQGNSARPATAGRRRRRG